MVLLIIPIVFVVILLMLFIVFLILSSRQEKLYKTMDKEGNVAREEITPEKIEKNTSEKKQETKKDGYKKEDMFKFMEFDRIMDNMIIQNGGSRFTMAIQCKGINYDLMSEMEQLSVEEGFITFLNTLKYPIQLYVQAQNIDLKGNIVRYKENIRGLTNDYNEITEEYNKLASSFDADENKLELLSKEKDRISNVYEYANDIIKYVEKMGTNKNLLQRKFFILLSYNTSEINAVDKFNKDEIIDMCSTELSTRCRGIISALSSCSVSGKILDSSELADLLYSAYNRDDKSLLSVKEAVDSGMLRLYSTSLDAFTKKQEQLEEYLRAQAKLRAYKAIKYAKEHDELETPASQALDEEMEISRRATNYIKNSDFSDQEKEVANKKILSDYREDKQTLLEINEIQSNVMKKKADEDIAKIPELEKVPVPTGVKLLEKSESIQIDPITGEVINEKNESPSAIVSEEKKQIAENNQADDKKVEESVKEENLNDEKKSDFNVYDDENDSIV